MPVRYTGRCLAAVFSALVLVAACGDDDDSSSATTSAAPTAATTAAATTAAATTAPTSAGGAASEELCAARDDLKASVQGLTDVDIVQDGTSGVQSALTQVREDLQAVRAAASTEMKPEVEAVEEALAQVQTALDSGGGAAGVVTAAAALAQSATTLVESLDALRCS